MSYKICSFDCKNCIIKRYWYECSAIQSKIRLEQDCRVERDYHACPECGKELKTKRDLETYNERGVCDVCWGYCEMYCSFP